MKKLHILLCLSILKLVACSNDTTSDNLPTDKTPIQGVTQVWKLVAMSGNVAGVPLTTGNNMQWQEKYTLKENGTFTKSRVINNRTLRESGSYNFVTLDDGEYLEFTYLSENLLIGNCTSDTKEFLRLDENNKLTGTWSACDGPGLFYERM